MRTFIKQTALVSSFFLTTIAHADVGGDYVCQDKLNVGLPAPVGAIDYWTNVLTSWTNTHSGEVEVFLRGPGLVNARTEVSGDNKDQRWLVPVHNDYPGQGVYVTFLPTECQSFGGGQYCLRNREEASSSILVAGVNEQQKKLQYREAKAQAGSVQALLTPKQSLVSYVLASGKRIDLGAACDSQEWYPHIPRDELNRTDLK